MMKEGVVLDIYVSAVATCLPVELELAGEAVARGQISLRDVNRDGYESLTVSGSASGPEMAVLAARRVLASAATRPEDVGLLVHSWLYHQGHDFWSPAHFVASELGTSRALPVGLMQMCDGALGLELAIDRMAARPTVRTALVTTGDRFAGPYFDRWSSDSGVSYGDGGTAVLLSRTAGRFRVLGIGSVAAPSLESMHRGDRPSSPAPRTDRSVLDIRETKRWFLETHGRDTFRATVTSCLQRAVAEALCHAGIAADDPRIRRLLLPRLGRSVLDSSYLPALEDLLHAEVVDLGRATGHLGAGDAAANLADLDRLGLLDPGEIAVVVSAGAGFTWTCVVVETPSENT